MEPNAEETAALMGSLIGQELARPIEMLNRCGAGKSRLAGLLQFTAGVAMAGIPLSEEFGQAICAETKRHLAIIGELR